MKNISAINIFLSRLFRFFLILYISSVIIIFFSVPNNIQLQVAEIISGFLKNIYNSNGNIEKITAGIRKFSILSVVSSIVILLLSYLWQRIIKNNRSEKNIISLPSGLPLNYIDWLIISSTTVIACLLRFSGLFQSLWQDEIGVYDTFIKTGILSTIFPLNSMGTHPLMQIIVGIFTYFTGVNEITLRLPVFLLSVLSVPLIYYITLRLSGRRFTAIIAALFLTIHSYHIYYSFQMRGYTMMVLFGMLSCYYLIKLLHYGGRRNSTLFIISNVLMVYTHLYSVFLLLSQHIVILLIIFFRGNRYSPPVLIFSRRNLTDYLNSFILSVVFICILYLPHVATISMTLFNSSPIRPSMYIPLSGEQEMASNIMNFFKTGYYFFSLSGDFIIPYIFLTGIIIFYIRTRKTDFIFQFLFFQGVLLYIFYLITNTFSYELFPRYMILLLPILIFLVSHSLSFLWFSGKKSNKIFFVILTGMYLISTFKGYSRTYSVIQDYRQAVEYVHNDMQSENSLIISNSLGKNEIRYYDDSIIPSDKIENFEQLINSDKEIYAIVAYSSSLNDPGFERDLELQKLINTHFTEVKKIDGIFPVSVWKKN